MATCTCLKLCSIAVALFNFALGIYIMVYGGLALQEYLDSQATIGLVIVYFQISLSLIFVAVLLLVGTIQEKEKIVSLYLLLSSLIWFIITMLAVSYMIFYNTTQYAHPLNETDISTTTTSTVAPTTPKPAVPVEKAVGFSMGLVLIWCGQLGVYKFHDQVIEKNMIDAGESYVSSAIRTN